MKKLLAIALLLAVSGTQVFAADGNFDNQKKGRGETQAPFGGGQAGG